MLQQLTQNHHKQRYNMRNKSVNSNSHLLGIQAYDTGARVIKQFRWSKWKALRSYSGPSRVTDHIV